MGWGIYIFGCGQQRKWSDTISLLSIPPRCLSTSQEPAPSPPKCVEVVRLVVVVRGRDKVPEKVTSNSESERLRDFKRFIIASLTLKCSIRVKDEGGKVRVKDARGNLRVKNARGNLRVNDARGNLRVKDARGNLRVKDARGNLRVKDARGNLRVKDASGKVRA